MTKEKMRFRDIFISDIWKSGVFSRAKKYFYGMPDALGWGEWAKWERETQAKYPISWIFLDTIPDFFYDLGFPFRRWYPHFRSKYIRKDHHIVLDVERFCELEYYEPDKPIYAYHRRDTDTTMLWAMQTMIIDYVEKEMHIIDWASSPESQKIHDEIMEIYNYWTINRPLAVAESTNQNLKSHDRVSLEDFMDTKERTMEEQQKIDDWDQANTAHEENMRNLDRTDTEMMIRTITMRQHLWS
jgi:hypothetical protein